MYKHQRLMYYEMKDFLENGDPGCRIAVLTGIRRIGKTGILTDLEESLVNAKYINFRLNSENARESCLKFIETGSGYLLVDEITSYRGHEDLIEYILFAVYNKCPRLKVVFAGSSSLHLLMLYYGPLGGSRSKLFRMSFLSFAEYMVFTGKRTSYKFALEESPAGQDFKDYLQLKELETSGFNLSFNDDYMRGVYQDISDSAKAAVYQTKLLDIDQADINCILDLVAYTLCNLVPWSTFVHPNINRELDRLGVVNIDMSGLRLCLSVEQLEDMNPVNIAKALYFILETNLAYMETRYEDNKALSSDKLAAKLLLLRSRADIMAVFEQYNICLVSPLWYTKLAKEIMDRHGISLNGLFDSSIYGEILENYIKGSYCRFDYRVDYHIYKIGSVAGKLTNKERSEGVEVDLYDPRHKLLCEISKGNKRRDGVNLMKHFENIPYIRILSTKDKENSKYGTHKIPYPKLCAMVDTGEIFSLERTIKTKSNSLTEVQINVNSSDESHLFS